MNPQYQREQFLLLDKIDKSLISLFKETEAIIAGGAITSIFSSMKINDYDLYFSSLEKAIKVDNFFRDNESFKLIFASENANLYKHTPTNQKYQVIFCSYYLENDPPSVYEHFDYTVCKAAYSFWFDDFYFDPRFFTDLAQRRLFFTQSTLFPINALYRVKKYISKGFTISGSELIKIALAIHNLKINTLSDLKKHLMGIDTVLIKALLNDLTLKEHEKYDYSIFIIQLLNYIDEGYSRLFEDE